jgi:outer membrane assembly lipoprotein YfiO
MISLRHVVTALFAILALGALTPAYGQWTWTPQTGRFINLDNMPKESPELQVAHARELMLEGNYSRALHETEKFVDFYEGSDYADENQFLRGEIQLAKGRHRAAAREFQQLVTTYPESDQFDAAIAKQFEIGEYFFQRGAARAAHRWRPFGKRPFRRAIEVYNMVIENKPFSEEAAQAQYTIGRCHFVREEWQEAAQEYRFVMEEYPGSTWVDDASHGLAICYYESSRPSDYDQSRSELAINAIDSFQQRFPGDTRGEGLVDKRGEMREHIAEQRLKMARFYEKRRRFNAARLSYVILTESYPETESADLAQEWLEANPTVGTEPEGHVLALQQEAT